MNGSKRGSPVRIFTNINPADVVLPSTEGYRYETILFFLPSVQVQNMLEFSWCNIFSEQATSQLSFQLEWFALHQVFQFFFQEFNLFSEKICNSLVGQRLNKTSHRLIQTTCISCYLLSKSSIWLSLRVIYTYM